MKIDVMSCLVCDSSVSYFEEESDYREEKCAICDEKFLAYGQCKNEHFICDQCLSNELYNMITDYVLKTKRKNPQDIVIEIMKKRNLYIHGPLHHYLMPAALLAAYKNAGGEIDLEDALAIAFERASAVPGGICGLWGACGAAIGAGVFLSIVTESDPLAKEQWRLPNYATSQALSNISDYGGPRCCKRNAFLTLPVIVDIANQNLDVKMEKSDSFSCFFFPRNHECLQEECKFHPKSNKKDM